MSFINLIESLRKLNYEKDTFVRCSSFQTDPPPHTQNA